MSTKSIQEAFELYHEENPQVYEWLVRQARIAQKRGQTRIGIDLLFCVLRWEHITDTTDSSQGTFRINDHYRSRYARLIMEQERDLEGFFETRQLRSSGPNRLYVEAEDGQFRLLDAA